MAPAYSAASFTKNFGWDSDFAALYGAIRSGFGHRAIPVTARAWRVRSGLPDRDRELIPLRFFLFGRRIAAEDFVAPDELVLRATDGAYGPDFDRLALFSFHLARSGRWRGSRWPTGRLAGWAHDYICEIVWRDGAWQREKLSDAALSTYIEKAIKGKPVTLQKVFTNYRYMLKLAGVLDGAPGPIPFSAGSWAKRACKVLWDRATYEDEINEVPSASELVDHFLSSNGFKLLGTSLDQGKAIAEIAAASYVRDGGVHRFAHSN